ncbi:hypothetical protein ACYSNR_17920 [Enterococcus sp. LJL128]
MKKKISFTMLGMFALLAIGGNEAQAINVNDVLDNRDYVSFSSKAAGNLFSGYLDDQEEIDLFENFGLFKRENLENKNFEHSGWEMGAYSLDGFQYLRGLDNYEMDGTYAVDYRPLGTLTQLRTFTDWGSPSYSIDFLKNLTQLEELTIDFNSNSGQQSSYQNEETGETEYLDYGSNPDKNLPPVYDISVLDSMPNLKRARISTWRYAQPIVLKEGITEYQYIAPIVLSDHFADAEINFSSSDRNAVFSEEDGVMTWSDISPYAEEIQFSWSVSKRVAGETFSFTGTTLIPIIRN